MLTSFGLPHLLALPVPVSVGALVGSCGVADATWVIPSGLYIGLSANSSLRKAVLLSFLYLAILKGHEKPSSTRDVISHLREL